MTRELTPNEGPIEATFTRWNAEWNATTGKAIARLKEVQASIVDADTKLSESTIRNREAAHRLEMLPERFAHERNVQQAKWGEDLRAIYRVSEINEAQHYQALTRERTALTFEQAKFVIAQAALVDAEQQLDAQKRYGETKYALTHQKQSYELLGVQLSIEELKAVHAKTVRDLGGEPAALPAPDDREINDALLARREQLDANGLDTSKIDTVIESRKRR